jgi:hypothetical protein
MFENATCQPLVLAGLLHRSEFCGLSDFFFIHPERLGGSGHFYLFNRVFS